MDPNAHRLYDRIKSNILSDDVGEEYRKFLIANKKRKQFKSITTVIIVAFMLATITYNIKYIVSFESFNSTLLFASLITITIATAIFNYLKPSRSEKNSSDNTDELRRYMDEQLFELRLLLGRQQKTETQNFSDEDKQKIINNIQEKLESEALSDYVSGIKQLLAVKTKEEVLENQFHKITNRLSLELDNLAKRGNLNLFLGIMTTLIGLGALSYSVFYSPSTQSPEELFIYFVPRISLVLLIEVFAYFFLRLYKQSLTEIKYFHNEITNIEAKQLAACITNTYKNPELINLLVENLSNTERNFILNKDQTTVDLERERISNQANADLLNTLKGIITEKKMISS